MKKGSLLALFGVLLAALVVAGCGGSDEDSSLTKAEFVKQANAICQEGRSEREELFKTFSKEVKSENVTKEEQESLVTVVFKPPYENTIDGLNGLTPPEGDEKQVEEIIAAMEEGLEKAEANPLVTLRTNIQFAEANNLAAKYGLKECYV